MRVVPLTEFLKYEYIEFYKYKNQPNINEYVYINRRGTPFETQNIDSKFKYLKTCTKSILQVLCKYKIVQKNLFKWTELNSVRFYVIRKISTCQ